MTAIRIIRRFRELRDVTFGSPADGDVVTYDAGSDQLTLSPPSSGGASTDTLADVLGRGADADAIEITNAADPTAPQSVATEASAQAQADAAQAAAEAASQPLDADLTAIAGLASGTAGAIASDGSGWAKKTYAQFKTALGLTSSDVGLGSVTNDAQLKASQLDTDATLAANSDARVASQKAVKTFAAAGDAASVATAEAYTDSSVAALSAVYQPLDSDLTAIAALSTTSFGRALLALADAAALRSAAGLGTAALAATGDFDAAGAAAAAQAASQPVDSDLTAIAALTTTSFGRALLALADAAALRTAAGLGSAAVASTGDFDAAGAAAAAQAASQPLDSDLTAIAALTTTAFGRALLELADAAALRTDAGLGTAATHAAGDFDSAGAAAAAQAASQPLDSDLTAIAALSTTAFGRGLLALADAAALRTSGGLVIGTDVEAHDADLTTIAGLSPTNDDVLQRKAGAWTNRTLAQLISDLAALGTTFQPLDSDLTSIAALSTTSFGRGLLALADAAALRTSAGLVIGTDVEAHDADLTTIAGLNSATSGAIASDGAGWIKKTYAQFKTALSLVSSDVGLGNVTNDAQLKASALDTDGTLAANSDTKIASQKATKTYVDSTDGVVARASGSSTSGTPGTSVASLTAGAGKRLVAWTAHIVQASAANTQLTVTITYTDSTTTTVTTSAATAATVLVNAGGIIVGGSVTALSAKEVSSIAVTTLGTGTGARLAAIAAMEVT